MSSLDGHPGTIAVRVGFREQEGTPFAALFRPQNDAKDVLELSGFGV